MFLLLLFSFAKVEHNRLVLVLEPQGVKKDGHGPAIRTSSVTVESELLLGRHVCDQGNLLSE